LEASRPRPRLAARRLLTALAVAVVATGCAASRPREEPREGATGGSGSTPVTPTPRTTTRPGAGSGVPGGGPPAPPPVSNAWRHARTVRIGLRVAAPDLLVSGSTRWTLTVSDGDEVTSEASGAPLRITGSEGENIDIYRGSERLTGVDGDDTLTLSPEGGGFSGWNGRWYRGTFRIYKGKPSGLTLVNEVPLEDYLRGVLPEEIGKPPETDFEAVKAQAVAARSYTLSYLGRRADLGFDLWATVEDQVYGGTARENAQSNRAVEATRGEILLSDDAPIRALYSSACGGRTSNVEDVWPWPWTPYLRSVRDAEDDRLTGYCSLSANYRWREEWRVDAFVAMLRKYAPVEGASVSALDGQLLDVRVESRSRSGRVREVVVATTDGECVLRGDRVRWSLRRPGGEAILRSSFIKIGVLRAADGAPLKVVATGAGNGHGIGMCQWGAMGMARAGKKYQEILRHYYKETRLARL
jgi:stage II sporulation protein D